MFFDGNRMWRNKKKERSRSALWHKAECCLYERWLKRTLRRESRNHSNFPGALWRTDNRVREEFLFCFFTPPSLPPFFPPSHLFSLSFPSRAVCWIFPSYTVFLYAAAFLLFLFSFCVLSKVQTSALRNSLCCSYLMWSVFRHFNGPSQLFGDFICVHPESCFALEKCAPEALCQLVMPLSTFQRLCCQTMVLPPRPITLR